MNLLNIIIYEKNKDFDTGYQNFNNIKKNMKKTYNFTTTNFNKPPREFLQVKLFDEENSVYY